MSAQLLYWLIYSEAGRVCRNLEQNPAGFAEVHRMEVLTVHYRGRVVAEFRDYLEPLLLVFIIRSTPRNVVNTSPRYSTERLIWRNNNIDDRTCSTFADIEPVSISLLTYRPK